MRSATNSQVLVLNQDYAPLNICGARRAVVLVLKEKAQLLENGRGEFRAVGCAYPIPTVIRLMHMVKRPIFTRQISTRRLSRREIFWRDDFTCQYCGRQRGQLTLDHVVPRFRSGQHSWDNVVTACVACNHRKAGRTPKEAGMALLHEPRAPKANPYHHLMFRNLPEEWSDYIPWMRRPRVSASA